MSPRCWLPVQDFFQLLQPGLQMLRPPAKDKSEKTVAGLVPFTEADFSALHGLRANQACSGLIVGHPALRFCSTYACSLPVPWQYFQISECIRCPRALVG